MFRVQFEIFIVAFFLIYRTQLTRIYYIVYKDGTVQPVSSKGRPTLPDVMTSLKTSSVSRDLYMSTDAIPYHLHFQALDANVTAVTSRKQQLTVAWQRYLQGLKKYLLNLESFK